MVQASRVPNNEAENIQAGLPSSYYQIAKFINWTFRARFEVTIEDQPDLGSRCV
jgi:hypothetical protein